MNGDSGRLSVQEADKQLRLPLFASIHSLLENLFIKFVLLRQIGEAFITTDVSALELEEAVRYLAKSHTFTMKQFEIACLFNRMANGMAEIKVFGKDLPSREAKEPDGGCVFIYIP